MGCVQALAAIASECNNGNQSGLSTTVNVVEMVDVATIPAATDHVVSDDITMEATKVFFPWAISKGDQQLVIEPVGENENIAYQTNMQFFIPKATSTKTNILTNTSGVEFILIAKDKQGNYRIIGDKDEGAMIKVKEQIAGENHGYLVTVSWTSNYLPYYYTGAIPLS